MFRQGSEDGVKKLVGQRHGEGLEDGPGRTKTWAPMANVVRMSYDALPCCATAPTFLFYCEFYSIQNIHVTQH